MSEIASSAASGATNARFADYRPDVDGLRAIAVIMVVVYHAFPDFLRGGFIGVDVFFVISGYLITGLILRDEAMGQFTLRHFYARRIRRIFPALLLVLAFCLGLGWLALTAGEYKQLGKYTAGGAAFVNNFLFWRDAGYFDNAADTKPLLHLWSLAIEEQFYLVWPLMLVVIMRQLRMLALPLAILLLASLAYSAWKVRVDLVADFYSPLTRFWELLLGGLLAYARHVNWRPAWTGTIAGVTTPAGLALIAAAALILDRNFAFPGLWVLLPTLGTALILWAGMESRWNRRVLAGGPLVWTGLISYPLYLWHWPLLSLARIFEGQQPAAATRLSLVAASVILAWLTYVLVERPIRFGKSSGRVVTALCMGMLLMLAAGHFVSRNDGLKFRHYNKLNADPATMVIGADRGRYARSCGIDLQKLARVEWCLHDNKRTHPTMALLGDSKGEALLYGLSRESSPDQSWVMIGAINLLGGFSDGIARLGMHRVLSDTRIKVVVLGNALRGFTRLEEGTGFIASAPSAQTVANWINAYTAAIERLAAAGKQVVFVMDHPTLPDPNSCISGAMTPFSWLNRIVYRNANPRCTMRYSEHMQGTEAYQAFVRGLKSANPGLLVFDPAPLLCDIPRDTCTYAESRQFLYSYGDHISDYASSKIARELLSLMHGRAQ